MSMILRDRTSRLAAGVSVGLHLILLMIFFLVNLDLWPQPADFTEIVFDSGTNRLASSPAAGQPSPVVEVPPKQDHEASAVVKLPQRTMPEHEPELKVPDRPKQNPPEQAKTILEPAFPRDRQELAQQSPTSTNVEQKSVAPSRDELVTSEKPLPLTDISSDAPGQSPYQIEGQAAGRTVIFKVIPEYPPDRQVMATIKISFTVLPNGNVGEMIPVIKSDALLEKITLDALRQWKFNPLPADAPQRVERGVITFRYLLK